MSEGCFLGIDVGTSGVRAALVNADGALVETAKSDMQDHGSNHRDPMVWWAGADSALRKLDLNTPVTAICVDGTSGTVLAIDKDGNPLRDALMYNDQVPDADILKKIASCAPPTSAVHGASSALARAIVLQNTPGVVRVIHQADWIAGKLSGRFNISDESNALKTGYDPVHRSWPQWLPESGIKTEVLPEVVAAGTVTGIVTPACAADYHLSENTYVVAGVSDGCASFLATGANRIGECVTALGSTITMKMLCDKPLFNPEYGVYSHRIGDRWLAGGASNSGGNVLAHYFNSEEIAKLSSHINTETAAPFDYYPLVSSGERFPHNDANRAPVVTPRPENDSDFLHCLFVGMAQIEALGYHRLTELGAPDMLSMRSVGGGSVNPVWSAIRQQRLQVPFHQSVSTEAAVGVALLARESVG